MTLSNLDILQPIPGFLRETYDVVHVGLVAVVVENDDPLPVLDNLLALLSIYLSSPISLRYRTLTVLYQSPADICNGMNPIWGVSMYALQIFRSPAQHWMSFYESCKG